MTKPPIASLAVAATLVFGSVAIAADPPVVLSVRKAVNSIDASSKKLKKSTIKKEIGGGQAELTLWKDSRGRLIKAKIGNYGDPGGSESELYWKDGVLVFAFESSWVLEPRFAKQGETEYTISVERRAYYSGGKASVVRIGKVVTARRDDKSVAVNRKKYPDTPSKTVPQSDQRWKEAVDSIAEDVKTAQKGNLNDWS